MKKILYVFLALLSFVAIPVIASVPAEGRVWVYEYDDVSETSASWVFVDTYCSTTEAGAEDGYVQCLPLNGAPISAPDGALPVGSHSAPVSILD